MNPNSSDNISPIGISAQSLVKNQIKRLPKPIRSVYEKSQQKLKSSLERSFSELDDILFSLAKNAVSQEEQDDFFFAMRTIRSQKDTIVLAFFDRLDKQFAAMNQPTEEANSNSLAALSSEDLSLVDYKDLDELIAKQALISEANSNHEHPLNELAKRFDAVVMADIDSINLPLSPTTLTDSLVEAVHPIKVSYKAIMALFKVYENEVLSNLGALYTEANHTLAQRGIFPEADVAIEKKEARSYDNVTANEVNIENSVGGMDLEFDPAYGVGTPPTNTAPTRHRVHKSSDQHSPKSDRRSHNGPSAQQNNQLEKLHQILRYLQQSHSQTNPRVNSGIQNLIELAHSEWGEHIELNTQARSRAQLISSLMDRLQSTAQFPPSTDTLLSQLELPLTQVALQDHKFLSSPKHSARVFLNSLSQALQECEEQDSDNHSDPLFKKAQQLIASICRIEQPVERDFTLALHELRDFQRSDLQRTKILEKRLLSAEMGRFKTDEAVHLVETTIQEASQNLIIHKVVRHFIEQGWKQVLLFCAIKYGTKSSQWDNSVQVLIDLILASQPLANESEVKRTQSQIPRLLAALNKGLSSIHFDSFKQDALLKAIKAFFATQIKPLPIITKKPALTSAQALQSQIEKKLQTQAKAPEDPALLAFKQQARGFSYGAWFSLTTDEGAIRCRLAAVISDYDKFIFVNRQGKKITDLHIDEVAKKLQHQTLVPLDSNQLFDRALEHVIGEFKRKSSKDSADNGQ